MSSTVTIRCAQESDKQPLYNLLTTDEQWTLFNGPYFPYQHPTYEEFCQVQYVKLANGKQAKVIDLNGRAIGSVSFYWENETTRWLEAGVVIYDSTCWGRDFGRQALIPWITQLFTQHDIARVGLTTWSGNVAMMRCAQKLGFTQEARLRKVRYYKGEYFDSIKYGVLREEWQPLNGSVFLDNAQGEIVGY